MRLKATLTAIYTIALMAPALLFAQQDHKLIKLDLRGRRGVVYFNHRSHQSLINPDPNFPYKAKQGAACSGCHHTSDADGVPQLWRCGACHRGPGDPSNPKNRESDQVDAERAFHDTCIGCHRASKKGPITCGGCHKPSV